MRMSPFLKKRKQSIIQREKILLQNDVEMPSGHDMYDFRIFHNWNTYSNRVICKANKELAERKKNDE